MAKSEKEDQRGKKSVPKRKRERVTCKKEEEIPTTITIRDTKGIKMKRKKTTPLQMPRRKRQSPSTVEKTN